MEVSNTQSYYSTANNNSDSTSSLSVQDFLKIMSAELQNQDPMSASGGGSNTDYISQLAQFSMLEEMEAISEGLDVINYMSQQQYSFSLIGKEVTLQNEEEIVTGEVEKVRFDNGYAVLVVNDKEYDMSMLIEVGKNDSLSESVE
ncbi:MAG: flagellar hook assembly protein FlgD [Eubacteriaceae bacterium]